MNIVQILEALLHNNIRFAQEHIDPIKLSIDLIREDLQQTFKFIEEEACFCFPKIFLPLLRDGASDLFTNSIRSFIDYAEQLFQFFVKIKRNDLFDLADVGNLLKYYKILVASIILNNRSIPIYFTMRNYPNHKEQYNHKKMESAFLKGLKHVLSKKYKYSKMI